MARIIYTPEKKQEIINKAKEIGSAAAARTEGVSYATVLKWMKEEAGATVEKVKNLPADSVAAIDGQIASVEAVINTLTEQLKEKKTELAGLKKAREKAEKVEAKERDLAEKKKVVEKVLKSGKSVEEILALLNS